MSRPPPARLNAISYTSLSCAINCVLTWPWTCDCDPLPPTRANAWFVWTTITTTHLQHRQRTTWHQFLANAVNHQEWRGTQVKKLDVNGDFKKTEISEALHFTYMVSSTRYKCFYKSTGEQCLAYKHIQEIYICFHVALWLHNEEYTSSPQTVHVVSMLEVPSKFGSTSFQSNDVSGAQKSEFLFCRTNSSEAQ